MPTRYISRIWGLRVLVVALLNCQAWCQQNVSVSNTSPQIIYTPFLCNATTVTSNPDCKGAWRVMNINGTNVVSTDGPDAEEANIIPQMFFQFRASALYLTTSVLSNATANLTVFAGSTVIPATLNTSVGLVDIVNLIESDITTLTITFVPGPIPSRLDIGSLWLAVTNDTATSSFLPSMTLPPSMSLPTFTPPSSTASSTSSASSSTSSASNTRTQIHKKLIKDALGLVLGLGLGLTFLTGIGLYYWKRRRRHDSASSSTNPNKQTMWFT